MLCLESGSSAGFRMQPYPRSRLAGSTASHGLPQCPGYGHWIFYLCVARMLSFGVLPLLASPDLGFGFGMCLGLGFCLPSSGPARGLRFVLVGLGCTRFAPA